MRVRVDASDVERVARGLGFSDRRTRAAIATAITRTARRVQDDWSAQLRINLDRPTPLTQRAVHVLRADATTLTATVQLAQALPGGRSGVAPAEYIATQEDGGARGLKKYERALVAAGAMPAGKRAVPGPAARLDGYGNVSRGQIVAVLNQLGAALSVGYQRVIGATAAKRSAVAKRSGRTYVALPNGSGRLKPGVYERAGGRLLLVFGFVSSVRYGKRLRLMQQAAAVITSNLRAEVDRAIAESLARLGARR